MANRKTRSQIVNCKTWSPQVKLESDTPGALDKWFLFLQVMNLPLLPIQRKGIFVFIQKRGVSNAGSCASLGPYRRLIPGTL